jgi:hypothetical protein
VVFVADQAVAQRLTQRQRTDLFGDFHHFLLDLRKGKSERYSSMMWIVPDDKREEGEACLIDFAAHGASLVHDENQIDSAARFFILGTHLQHGRGHESTGTGLTCRCSKEDSGLLAAAMEGSQ